MTGFTYSALQAATTRPEPFSVWTTDTLWTDEHISAQMLRSHLDPDADGASRAHPAIKRSLDWIVKRFDLGPGKRVIDFGCGPGLHTTGLAECGVAVTGIDFSRRSLELPAARRVAPASRSTTSRWTTAAIGPQGWLTW